MYTLLLDLYILYSISIAYTHISILLINGICICLVSVLRVGDCNVSPKIPLRILSRGCKIFYMWKVSKKVIFFCHHFDALVWDSALVVQIRTKFYSERYVQHIKTFRMTYARVIYHKHICR